MWEEYEGLGGLIMGKARDSSWPGQRVDQCGPGKMSIQPTVTSNGPISESSSQGHFPFSLKLTQFVLVKLAHFEIF